MPFYFIISSIGFGCDDNIGTRGLTMICDASELVLPRQTVSSSCDGGLSSHLVKDMVNQPVIICDAQRGI